MKKILILIGAAVMALPAYAKKKKEPFFDPSFTLRAGFGYALPVAGTETMAYDAYIQPINGTQSYDGTYNSYNLKKASFAAGLGAVIAPGLMLNQHIGVEVGVGLGLAMKQYKFTYTTTAPNNPATVNFTSHAEMPVVLLPAIVVSTGDTRISGYARAGLAIPVAGKIVTEESYSDKVNGTESSTFEVRNRISVGISGAAGVRYKMNRVFGLWAELNGMSLSLMPKTGQYTSLIQNGAQILGQINTSDTHFEYESNYSERDNNSSSQPTKTLAFSSAFSNIGFSVGVSLGF